MTISRAVAERTERTKLVNLAGLCLLVMMLVVVLGRAARTPAAAVTAAKGVNWSYIDALWATGPHSYNWAGVASDLADMNGDGITWARVPLDEGQPFTFYDHIVYLAWTHHIQLLFVIFKGAPQGDLGTPAQQARTQAWLAQAVDRYKFYVHDWEVHNEPNLSGSWNIQPGGPAAAYNASVRSYVHYLRQCYQTIKAHDAGATVILGGVSDYDAAPFVSQLIADQAYRYIDAVAFHPYASDPAAVGERLRAFAAELDASPPFRAKPIWITEIGFQHEPGWKTPGYVASEQQKARYLVLTMQKLRRDGITTPIFWYTLHEHPDVNGFGLERKDARHTVYLPAFYAYQSLWSR